MVAAATPESEDIMPRGSKSKYTSKQKRKAEHIEEGYEKRGTSHREAERRAWATVNKQEGGGKKGGSGSKRSSSKSKSSKGSSSRSRKSSKS
jgi:plasmid stabilization system protein ParE